MSGDDAVLLAGSMELSWQKIASRGCPTSQERRKGVLHMVAAIVYMPRRIPLKGTARFFRCVLHTLQTHVDGDKRGCKGRLSRYFKQPEGTQRHGDPPRRTDKKLGRCQHVKLRVYLLAHSRCSLMEVRTSVWVI